MNKDQKIDSTLNLGLNLQLNSELSSDLQSQLHTIVDYIRWAVSQFNKVNLSFGHGTDNALDEAITLLKHVLHLPHDIPSALFSARLTNEEKKNVLKLINLRVSKRLPLPYLTNEAWFAEMPFYVDNRVLVPRSPLAELIEHRFEPWLDLNNNLSNTSDTCILDLCTGSGCIAIACAVAFPECQVDAVDISQDALEVANINIKNHSLQGQVNAIHSDLFDSLSQQRYNIIISNPPYVDEVDMANLPAEFQHEPSLGLVAGRTGLDVVCRILRSARDHLLPGGLLIVEVGNSEAALKERYSRVAFTWLEFERGGEGVFLLTYEQLVEYEPFFNASY